MQPITYRLGGGLALALALLLPRQLPAQDPLPAREGPGTVGLVLSGGAARGLAHVGVMRVLEEAGVPVHVVTGTSMGSILGGLYAIGYTVAEIDSLVRTVSWTELLDDPAMQPRLAPGEHQPRPPFFLTLRVQGGRLGLPSGMVAGREITHTLSRLLWPAGGETDFTRLPIPFTTVATDLETGELVVLEEGSLRRAIRASMSMPSIFETTPWNGRQLIDGGLVRNLPASEARDLGADILVCSDATTPLQPLDHLTGLTDVLGQAITFQVVASAREQRALCDVVIDAAAGVEAGWLDFHHASEWIEAGERAARQALPRLRQIAARATPAPPRSMPLRPDAPVRVTGLRVEAESPRIESTVLRLVRTPLPRRMTAGDAAAVATEVRDAYRFSRVGYRLEAAGADTTLVIEVEGRPAAEVGLLFRFDDWYAGSLLFAATFHDRFRFGSETHLDARLGEQLLLRARHLQNGIARKPLDLAAEARYRRVPLYEVGEGRRLAELRYASLGASAYAGWRLDRFTGAGVQMKVEHGALGTAVGESDTSTVQRFGSLSLLARRSTMEGGTLARRGGSVLVRSEWARRGFGSGAEFAHHLVDAARAISVGEETSLQGRLVVGRSAGPDLPPDRRFYVGGAHSGMALPEVEVDFPALHPQELSGRTVAVVDVSAIRRPRESLAVGVRATAAEVGGRDAGSTTRVVGAGITAAALTRLGDLRVDVAGRRVDAWPRVSVLIGAPF